MRSRRSRGGPDHHGRVMTRDCSTDSLSFAASYLEELAERDEQGEPTNQEERRRPAVLLPVRLDDDLLDRDRQ